MKAFKRNICTALFLSAHCAFALTIHMIGDSTMADKPVIPANPERGWGQMLHMYFKDNVEIANHARNGRSSKSFIAEGRWETVLAALKPGDYVIIQFGHNDEKTNDVNRGTAPFGDFTTNLVRFVSESREHGAVPILATAVARRKFDNAGKLQDTHGDYIVATRRAAIDLKVPLLDLNKRTSELLAQMGPEQSKRLFDWIEPGEFEARPNGLKDDTHFNAFGASRVCDLAVDEVKTTVPELAKHLKQ
jgi:lysophospholipase L1-like esterase